MTLYARPLSSNPDEFEVEVAPRTFAIYEWSAGEIIFREIYGPLRDAVCLDEIPNDQYVLQDLWSSVIRGECA
jgi:hypothetical protein